MSWRSAARASSKPAAINQHRRTLISSLSLPAATTEEQACCQAGWPADVQHRILFLEPCCFYRLTALKYGPNPFIAPLVWLLLEVVHIQASEQNPPCISPVIWRPLFFIKLWECSFFPRLLQRNKHAAACHDSLKSSLLFSLQSSESSPISKGKIDIQCRHAQTMTLCFD